MEIIPHQLTKNVKLLQKAALWHNGKVLILKRSSDSKSRPNQWDLPGGNSEWPVGDGLHAGVSGMGKPELRSGEKSEDGFIRDLHKDDVVREVFEETGIELKREDVKKCVHIGTFFDGQKQVFSIILGWEVKLAEDFREDSVLLSDEHSDLAWMRKDESGEFDFGFAGDEGGFIRSILGV